jgi:uncharacterized protein
MLCFDIRSLETRAAHVDGWLDGADAIWAAEDVRPAGAGVHVVGRLSSAGPGRVYLSGRLDGTAVTACRRCLAEVAVPVSEPLHLLFSSADDEAEGDEYPIPTGVQMLDLRPAVREEWLLAVPAFALCREACRGLCPTCGADRNAGECSCPPPTDPRWDGLRAVRRPAS